MSNVIPLHSEPTSAREMVAAEVRAELARQRHNSNSLPRFLGKSQRYWYERLNARLSFSVDDLAALSAFLQVPMVQFIPSVIAPNPSTPDAENAPTDGEGVASNQLTSDYKSADAEVTDLASFRAAKAAS